jgi:glycosyltransferase involved in cell wall biosynthesis
MKINILYNFREGPWGGGNQFLKALRNQFLTLDCYESDFRLSDVVLVNNYPFGFEEMFWKIFKLKLYCPEIFIIIRVDGPVALVRGADEEVDHIICLFNKLFCDGIIFQSEWSMLRNKERYEIYSVNEVIIHNAPDENIFNNNNKKSFNTQNKVRLIATSWSANWKKGFQVYKYLDDNLDFSRYEMTFVGNSPIQFRNIHMIGPLDSEGLAGQLKQHDIFITASEKDPCSNSLIEALSCGLPAVAYADGGHPELIHEGGELFENIFEIIDKIDKVVHNYERYKNAIPSYSIRDTANKYYNFCYKIFDDYKSGRYFPKKLNMATALSFCSLIARVFTWKARKKFFHVIKRTYN